MDLLNNLNVVIGIIGGVFGIEAYLFAFISWLQNKAASSQQKQAAQLQFTYKSSPYAAVSKSLSRLD